jgi:steroid delta-isomerase-like uncharacterized protein
VGPPAGATNADLIRWSFERLNAHDAASMAELWSDETVERLPDRTLHGAAETVAYFEEVFAALPDVRVEIQALAEQGDDVIVRWRMTGTHDGAIQGVDGTGRRLTLDGVDHFTLRDGKIVSNFIVYDQMQWARDIGMLPADDSPADRAFKAAFNAKTRVARQLQARRSTS